MEGVKAFEAFYNVKHSGRVLTFRPELGSVDVKTKFKTRTHELSVSTHSMCVLALFEGLEEDESLSYKVNWPVPRLDIAADPPPPIRTSPR